MSRENLDIHEITKAKIGIHLLVNAYTKAFKKHGKEIPEKAQEEIREMVKAGMYEAERLGLI